MVKKASVLTKYNDMQRQTQSRPDGNGGVPLDQAFTRDGTRQRTPSGQRTTRTVWSIMIKSRKMLWFLT